MRDIYLLAADILHALPGVVVSIDTGWPPHVFLEVAHNEVGIAVLGREGRRFQVASRGPDVLFYRNEVTGILAEDFKILPVPAPPSAEEVVGHLCRSGWASSTWVASCPLEKEVQVRLSCGSLSNRVFVHLNGVMVDLESFHKPGMVWIPVDEEGNPRSRSGLLPVAYEVDAALAEADQRNHTVPSVWAIPVEEVERRWGAVASDLANMDEKMRTDPGSVATLRIARRKAHAIHSILSRVIRDRKR